MGYAEMVKKVIEGSVDQYSIIEGSSTENIIRFYNGKISIFAQNEAKYVQVLATKGKKKAFKVITDLNNIEKESSDLLKELERSEEGDVPQIYGKTSYSSAQVSDKEVELEEALARVSESIKLSYSKGIDRVAGIAKLYKNIFRLLTSTGNEKEDLRTDYIYYVRAFKGEGSGFGNSVSTSIKRFNPELASEEASKDAINSQSPKKLPEGKYDVILSPPIAASIFELTSSMCSAYAIEAGFSFLADKLGEKVASDLISITDFGMIEDGVNSRSFDDEGAPTGVTQLIDKGVFVSPLHNSTTAKKWGSKTTGNAGIIEPSPWNVIVKEGSSTLDEMIKEVKEGVLITNNWYTRFNNYRTGEFSTIVRDAAYYIKDGEIKHPVNYIRLSDSLPRLLSSVKLVSRESKWIKWWGEVVTPVKSPYILVEGSTLTVP